MTGATVQAEKNKTEMVSVAELPSPLGHSVSLCWWRLDPVRATLERRGGYTVTWADGGENQSMNNQPKDNKGDLT